MDFPVAGWANITPWGLASIFVMLVLLGQLIPRWVYNRMMKDKDDAILALNKALDKRDEQLEKLAESNRIIIGLLEEIKRIGKSDKETDSP